MPSSLVKSFADKTGKSIDQVEKIWKDSKSELMKDKATSDPSFFPVLTSIVKRKLGIKENLLDRFKNWIKGE